MDIADAARQWAQVWQRAWPAQDGEAIMSLYADTAVYRALAFREPDLGLEGVRDYLRRNFTAEHDVECWFGAPVAHGNRAAVEWWASWEEDGAPITMAGTTLLTFDPDGQVVDHRDYWNQQDGRRAPYDGWASIGSSR
ncbi:MAG TPA: nuclear transport factor 2 family protein [Jatrophihabitantaceae bacterium]|nr:nuclear transport factor 2 family protein [Jatrophihabitantaceae bacterium]